MKNLSFSAKIWILIAILALVSIVITSVSTVSTRSIVGGVEEVNNRILPLDAASYHLVELQKDLMTFVAMAGSISNNEAQSFAGDMVSIYTKGEKLSQAEAIGVLIREYDKLSDEMMNLITDTEKLLVRPEMKAIFARIETGKVAYIEVGRTALEAFQKHDATSGLKYLTEIRNKHLPPLRAALLEFSNEASKMSAEKIAEINSTAAYSIILGIVISLVSIISVLTLAFFVMRTITKSLLAVVEELSNSSEQVTAASGQIASASEQLSQSTNDQAAALEETAASVEEINSMIKKNSENADYTASTTKTTKETIAQGERTIDQMTEAMTGISKSTEAMTDIVKVISQIDKKTKVINEIVTKTELLSFNASVEAARAGEHGKGFAVVAEEVGNLARMSGSAAEEISTLLESSTATVNSMVTDTKKQVEVGTVVTKQCEEVFGKIVKDIALVSDKAVEIASASQEQTNGASEISKAIGELDVKTQQNASTSEECASAASELLGQAEGLTAIVDQLKITIYGASKANVVNLETRTNLKPKKESAKIIAMKKPTTSKHITKTSSASAKSVPLAKAVPDDVPGYDDGGFTDV